MSGGGSWVVRDAAEETVGSALVVTVSLQTQWS